MLIVVIFQIISINILYVLILRCSYLYIDDGDLMAPTRIGLPDISMTQMEYLVAVQETSTWANAAR